MIILFIYFIFKLIESFYVLFNTNILSFPSPFSLAHALILCDLPSLTPFSLFFPFLPPLALLLPAVAFVFALLGPSYNFYFHFLACTFGLRWRGVRSPTSWMSFYFLHGEHVTGLLHQNTEMSRTLIEAAAFETLIIIQACTLNTFRHARMS